MSSAITKGALIGAAVGVVIIIVLTVASQTLHALDAGERAEWFQTYLYFCGFPVSQLLEAVRFGRGTPMSSTFEIVLQLSPVPINWSLIGGLTGAVGQWLVRRAPAS